MRSINREEDDFVLRLPEMASGLADILHFNERLEAEAELSVLTESLIEARLRALDDIRPVDERFYWLTIGRLAELALYCAGNYADNLHFEEAGDLLVNPRLVVITPTTEGEVDAKDRHGGISRQFRSRIGEVENPAIWLKMNVSTQIKEEAVLPQFLGRMKGSSCLREEYVSSVEERMKKISDTIAFLSAWHVPDAVGFHERLRSMAPSERKAIESELCKFDKKTFDEIGRDLHEMAGHERLLSKFLRGGAVM